MNLSRLGNMFTEAGLGEKSGEIKEESSVIDLDFGIGNLSVTPVPYESSSVRDDELSLAMIQSDVSAADVLLPAFGSISFAEVPDQRNDFTKHTIETKAVGSICEAILPGQRIDEGNDTTKLDSSDFSRMDEPSTDGHGEVEIVGEIENARKSNNPLIVYKSTRRKSVRNTNNKPNQNNESRKPPRNCRKTAKTSSVLDLNSLQVSRRRRSLFSKRARSSAWGLLRNILPDFEEHNGIDPNLGSEKNPRKVIDGKGKRYIRDQSGPKSVQKSCTPTGRISLKIKIGNQSCAMVNVSENHDLPAKSFSGLSDISESKFEEKLHGDVILPPDRNLEKVMPSDSSVLGTHLDKKGSIANSIFSTLSDLYQIIGHEDRDNLGASTDNRCSDPGTSPDSEVINSVPGAPLFEKGSQNLQDSPIMPMEGRHGECLTNTGPDVSLGDVSYLTSPKLKSKKGKKKDKRYQCGDPNLENGLTNAETSNNAKLHKELRPGQKVVGGSYWNDESVIATAKPYLNTYRSNRFSRVPLHSLRMTDSGTPSTTSDVYYGAQVNLSSGLVAGESSHAQPGDILFTCSNLPKLPKCSASKGGIKGRSGILNLPKKKEKTSKKKGDKNNLVAKHHTDERVDACGVLSGVESLGAGNPASSDFVETQGHIEGISGPVNNLQLASGGQRDQSVTPDGWVLCDECQKWRRIPAALSERIGETNCRWICKDNTDKDFADCSIPQEKSNSEINKELGISDCEEDKAVQPSEFQLIKSNLFLHRSRKTQTIDEVMVCHCKPPSDGRMGCGAKCLNRMLNIECVRGTCPCGELCSNQQFQERKYASVMWFKCGKKGYGLQSLEDISEGRFLIEYVGEVLDIHAYEARQMDYALQGHKHFYFMTLNGSEVIDACAKGNLGRFINHSCDPNCRTEKWMVNGEVCVGLFAVRDIKKGEELTFDYNYVRVFGAAAKKCVCGSPNCRGYIGGDPTNAEVIVQDDSDDEYSEPVMTCEDREMNDDWNAIMSNSLRARENESVNEPYMNEYRMKKVVNADGLESITSETSNQKVGNNSARADECFKTSTAKQVVDVTVRNNNEPDDSVGGDFASNEQLSTNEDARESFNSSASAAFKVESEAILSQMHSPVQLTDVSFQSEAIIIESKRNLNYGTAGGKDELAKSGSHVKTRRSSSSIKKGKLKSSPDVDKSNAAFHKSKKLTNPSLDSHVEAVEAKLNELLDTEGGISKRKDASRGYLKLLFLTAASTNDGEAIQSNRDLSMILDALLKTKSRTVLVDIINKNGLQMLHNIMKRYRKVFIKTPILRKLLKVLEYMAMREILTLDHITGGPPCPGVESFRDSILTLTEHADKQVHQIARNFRDRWIPRSLRKNCFMEPDNGKVEFHRHGRLSASSNDHWGDRGGIKPSEVVECRDTQTLVASSTVETPIVDPTSAPGCSSGTNGTRIRKRKSRWDTPAEDYPQTRIRTNVSIDEKSNTDDDIPPGFSPICNDSMVPPDSSSINLNRHKCRNHPFDIVPGDTQERFSARMPLSFGVPSSVMQQFGTLKPETAEGWVVAPGLPFHPFPPLPPNDRDKWDPSTPAAKCASSSEPAERAADQGVCHAGQKRPVTCGMDPPEMDISVANERPDFQREGGSYSLGRKYFKQQKWNHSKLAPPWVRMRNGWGNAGNTRNGVGFGNGLNQLRNSYNSEEFNNWGGEF